MNGRLRFGVGGIGALVAFLLLVALAVLFPLGRSVAASATTFTVNSTADLGDGVCDATECTLREAITAANANPGTDTIAFNIPGAGPHTIQPTSALPTITDPVVIDAYTEPGASPNTNPRELGINAVVKIELDGSGASSGATGLHITAGKSVVRGLAINRFGRDGIQLDTAGGNLIEGNFISSNGYTGVSILGAPGNTIGGTTPGARNVISGNDAEGVYIEGTSAAGNLVQGNFIGTDVAGTAAVSNASFGVGIQDAINNIIGGTTAGAGNVISGNARDGIGIGGIFSAGNQVLGNLIGTDATGSTALPNALNGVFLHSGSSTTVQGNIISGNARVGIGLAGGTVDNQLLGNFIGTQIDGTSPLGNASHGVFITDLARNNTVGGTASGAGNTIAFNGGNGVNLGPDMESLIGPGTGNAILSNSIFSNSGLGIDLGTDAATPNDPGDGDTGANDLQNFPVLTAAASGSVAIGGTLNSTPDTEFRLEFFSNSECDASGYGEGETFLGSTMVTTDGRGDVSFAVTFADTVAVGQFITATATDRDNNTSEFSQCIAVEETAPPTPPPGVGGIVEIQITGSGSAIDSVANSSGGSPLHHYIAVAGAVAAAAMVVGLGAFYARRRWLR